MMLRQGRVISVDWVGVLIAASSATRWPVSSRSVL